MYALSNHPIHYVYEQSRYTVCNTYLHPSGVDTRETSSWYSDQIQIIVCFDHDEIFR